MTKGIPPLAATAVAGAGSIATVAISVIAMKAFAVLVGPQGVGAYALLLSILNLGVLAASVGLQASAITAVGAAHRDSGGPPPDVARHAVLTAIAAGLLGALLLTALSGPIAKLLPASTSGQTDVIFLAVALALTVTATVGGSVLVGIRRLKASTLVSIATAFIGTVVGVSIVSRVGIAGFAPSLALTAAVQLMVTWAVLRGAGFRTLQRPFLPPARTARQLVALGVPVALGQSVSTGALLLMPIIVLQLLGPTEVGYYRSAAVVSLGIGTFFIAGIHQDFLPRMSAASARDRALMIERQMRIVVGIALPLVLLLLAVGPALIDFLYTAQFRPALNVLQWQLIGDLVRLPMMVIATALVAMRSRASYFAIEAAGGLVLVGASAIGASIVGLTGLGMGYACAQIVTYAAAWMEVRRQLHLGFGRLQVVLVATLIGTSVTVAIDPSPVLRIVLFLPAAIMAALVAWPRLLRLHRANSL